MGNNNKRIVQTYGRHLEEEPVCNKVICLGTAGSGKSTFFHQWLASPIEIDKDKYKAMMDDIKNDKDSLCSSRYVLSLKNLEKGLCSRKHMYLKSCGILDREADDLKMVDMGGARVERKKWAHTFQDVGLVLYFMALPALSRYLREDTTCLELHETAKMFKTLALSRWLGQSSYLLILTGKDCFDEEEEKALRNLLKAEEGKPILPQLLDYVFLELNRQEPIPCFVCNLLDESDVEDIKRELPNLLKKKKPETWFKSCQRSGSWDLYHGKIEWNPENHKYFPLHLRQIVFTLLLCFSKISTIIPKDIQKMIICFTVEL